MARRLARLTLDNLGDLPTACQTCAFWELDPVRRDRALRCGDLSREKEDWVSGVLLEWGSCGRVAYVDDDPAGYVLFAPPAFAPGADGFPTSPVSEDAVLLLTAMVFPEYAGSGLGRSLVQAAAKDLSSREGVHAIEAFGAGARSHRGYGHCVLPADFLLRVGFKTHRPHPRYPRMRLELRSLVSWRDEVEAALEKLFGAVRPGRLPRPVRGAMRARRPTGA